MKRWTVREEESHQVEASSEDQKDEGDHERGRDVKEMRERSSMGTWRRRAEEGQMLSGRETRAREGVEGEAMWSTGGVVGEEGWC